MVAQPAPAPCEYAYHAGDCSIQTGESFAAARWLDAALRARQGNR